MIKVLKTEYGTIVDGEGMRVSVYLAGCSHKCKGCQNPDSWNPSPEKFEGIFNREFIEDLTKKVNGDPLILGITLTGGDPLFNPQELLENLMILRLHLDSSKDIWLYTGYTFEEILQDKVKSKIAELLDVIVDGKFEENKKDLTLIFKGSSNQRIIRSKQSVLENKIILWEDTYGNFTSRS